MKKAENKEVVKRALNKKQRMYVIITIIVVIIAALIVAVFLLKFHFLARRREYSHKE